MFVFVCACVRACVCACVRAHARFVFCSFSPASQESIQHELQEYERNPERPLKANISTGEEKLEKPVTFMLVLHRLVLHEIHFCRLRGSKANRETLFITIKDNRVGRFRGRERTCMLLDSERPVNRSCHIRPKYKSAFLQI